jgi:lysophospholipase L1-like esterase
MKNNNKLAISVSILFCLTFISNSALAQDHSDPRWVTSWATSPSTLPGSDDDGSDLQDQTVRLIVHTSIGGDSMRLRLSNYHGTGPVEIGAVSVALHNEESTVIDSSAEQVLFAGMGETTIARGATVLSDPLDFTVPELSNLAVSIYLPGDSGFLTAHALSNQNNYVSTAGNFTASTEMAVDSETPAWYLLTAIDVIADEAVSAFATVGDSITDGWGSTASTNNRWPNHFARRLYAAMPNNKFAIVNAGISGNRVTTEESPMFGQNLQARFERDVLALSDVTHMVLMEGINDIGMSARAEDPVSAQQVIAGYRQIITRAHANGIKIFGATLTPYEGAAYYTAGGEMTRQQVNDFIRNSGEFDGVIDFEKAVQDPENPARILPSFTEDNLHPNDEGYKAMAEIIDLSLFQ